MSSIGVYLKDYIQQQTPELRNILPTTDIIHLQYMFPVL